MVQTPKWRVSAGVDYKVDAGVGELTADVNASYSSSFFWNPDNLVSQKGYTLLNASLMLVPAGAPNTFVRLWANNLTQREYNVFTTTIAGGGGMFGHAGAPRTFGLEAGIKL